jgi:hypothetical protein
MPLGRPRKVDFAALLILEQVWYERFRCLRDGGTVVLDSLSRPSMLLKIDDGKGHRRIEFHKVGERPRIVESNFSTSVQEARSFAQRTAVLESELDKFVSGDGLARIVHVAVAAERHLFDALLRTNSQAAVRRICRRSNCWLKFRWDLGKGHFQEIFSPCPRALYDYAEEFCHAKLDRSYPARDRRPSGDYRRIRYFARVMAGLSLPKPIKPSYALKLFRNRKRVSRKDSPAIP